MKKTKKKKESAKRVIESVKQDDVFTMHPPDLWTVRTLSKLPAYVAIHHLRDKQLAVRLKIKHNDFTENENPFSLMEAFAVAHKAGIYPPMWVLDEIMHIFQTYYDAQGKESLDKLFGFAVGSGGDSRFKEHLVDQRDAGLMLYLFRLRLLGCTIEEAAHMVAEHPENKRGWKIGNILVDPLKESYLKKIYKEKRWSKIYGDQTFKIASLEWLGKNKDVFLKPFPKESFPVGKILKLKKSH